MNHLTTASKYDPKCYVHGNFTEEQFTVFEYDYDKDGIQFCNIQKFEVEGIEDITDCIDYINEQFAEGMKYIYSVEDSNYNYYIIKLRYTDLQDEYIDGKYHEYVFSI